MSSRLSKVPELNLFRFGPTFAFQEALMDDSERIYYGVKDETLLAFDRPTDTSILKVGEFLNQLAIRPDEGIRSHSVHESITPRIGTLVETLERIGLLLENDFDTNQRECHEWNGSFEYEVGFSTKSEDFEIRTRLFSGDRGSVIYASAIRRIAADQFLLWDGHTDTGK